MNLNQITKHEEVVGKTIRHILYSGMEMWMKFSDNSFAVFECEYEPHGFSGEYRIQLDDWHVDKTSTELVDLGIVSEAEHEKLVLEEKLKYEKLIADNDEQRRKLAEDEELKMYQELHKKYGKNPLIK